VSHRRAPSFFVDESKLWPPVSRPGAVARTALVARLRAVSEPVVTVAAPTGYGKTTLLAQWAQRDGRDFVWLSIDEHDNDLIVLMTYVATGLHRVGALTDETYEALRASAGPVSRPAARLVSSLGSLRRPAVLVIDDAHLLRDPPCIDALTVLSKRLPPEVQMVISGRATGVVPIGRLRAQGRLHEVETADLALDATESAALLRGAGVNLTAEQAAELTEITEGWPAGLYLAALSLRASNGGPVAAKRFTCDRYVSEYLRTEVLGHLSRGQVQFLTRTSILERLSGPLCDAVMGRTGSASILESIARLNGFLIPLDDQGRWFRHHQLFRTMLRADVDRSESAVMALRASAWCEANGMMDEAVGYARQGQDPGRLGRLISLVALPTLHAGRIGAARRWFDWLEEDGLMARDPPTAVIAAWLHALMGEAAATARLAEVAEQGTVDGPMPDGARSIESWRAMLRAALCQDGAAAMHREARAARRGIPTGSPWRGTVLLLLGVAEVLAGDPERASDTLADAVDVAMDRGDMRTTIVALGERALLGMDRGDWTAASGFVDAAVSILDGEHLEGYVSSIVFAAAARAAIHRGDLDQARTDLARAGGQRPLVSSALPWYAVQTLLALAGSYVALGDIAGARALLSEAEGVERRRPGMGSLTSNVAELRERLAEMPRAGLGASTLTAAEIRLLPLLATHLSFREIGARLFVSSNTVKTQAISVYRKLATNSRGGAVERARELGFI
jgi:LuxR family maltose regulon positive regulatory protein